MTWKIKLLSAIGIIALFCGLLLVIKYQRDIINKQATIQDSLVEMKKIQGDVTRSQTQYATPADIDKLANSLDLKLDPIKDDLKTLNAHVTGIQTVTVVSNGDNKSNVASTTTTPRTDPIPANEPVDQFGYQKNAQTLALTEPFGKTEVPVGNVSFSAWQKAPWSYVINKRTYSVVNVLGSDEDGKSYTYSKFAVTVDGKVYDIDINDTKLVEELPQAKFRFSPRFYISMDFGSLISKPEFQFLPNLQLVLFSRGVNTSYPTWLFLGIGGGYNVNSKAFGMLISPFSYNIGQFIPFAKNIYVGPALGMDAHGNFSVLGGVRVGL